MKVAIFGSSGMLGHVLTKLCILKGIDADFFSRKKLPGCLSKVDYKFFDINSYDVNSGDYDYVVNCCGLIKQRNGSDRQFYSVNSDFPKRLSKKYGTRLIHISTDCVFSGKKGNYIETDTKDCQDVYGLSKSEGEEIESRVFRTSIIGTHPEDKNGLLEWFRNNENKKVNGYTDHFWGGVTTLELSREIIKELENVKGPHIRHVYSQKISKFEIISLIKEVFEIEKEISCVEAGKVDRSLSTILENNPPSPSLKTQLKELREFERVLI